MYVLRKLKDSWDRYPSLSMGVFVTLYDVSMFEVLGIRKPFSDKKTWEAAAKSQRTEFRVRYDSKVKGVAIS